MPKPTDDLLQSMPEYCVTDRRLLICVGEDPALLHGVRFVSSFFQPAPDLRIYLAFTPGTGLRNGDPNRLSANEARKWATSMLMDKGFIVDAPRSDDVWEPVLSIREIARIAEKKRYDAVILGRRAIHHLEEHLDTEFNETVFDRHLDFPFWICREPDTTRVNVLLCVDGSKPGLCAADHVGWICASESRHQVCVAYIADPAKRDYRDEILILDNAVKMLQVNGIPESRIRTKVLVDKDYSRGILEEAQRGEYAVVAVGRAGSGRGMMAEQQFGAISLLLARKLAGASLWVCGYPCKL
ncbi:hypothetical protein [Desulfonatronum parangueonense]